MMIDTTRVAKSVLLAICLVFWVSACAATDDAAPPSAEPTLVPASVEDLGDGTIVVEYDLEEAAEEVSEPEVESASLSSQRDCVYIEYCRSPSTGGIVCRSRTCGCSAQEASDECVRDARAVCGHSRAMTARLCAGG